ncbi:dephospho-CoA kinase-domain-containing protein [Phlebopus sp. FC_14]|nr:dephospho-CoA kinase-domain-containing protein [Phlebopus sp. FC_14]
MLVVGLTGGIATGKSTVSNLFKSYSTPIIDADVLARSAVAPGTHALSQIVSAFGPSVLLPDGTLDRKKLGSIVFNDETKRKTLNGIVHPAVTRSILWGVLKCWIRGEKMVVVDVPLLIEGGLWRWMAKVVVVYCSAEIQLQRLMARDGSSREDALARLTSQLPISEKVAYADIVIENSGSLQDLEEEVQGCVEKLRRAAGWSWRLSWLVPPYGLLTALWTLGWKSWTRSGRRRTGEKRR